MEQGRRGLLSMAGTPGHTGEFNGSQFFILFKAAPFLNGEFCVIGEVMDSEQNHKILDKTSDIEEITYQTLTLPTPSISREFITKKLSLKISEGEYVILFYSVDYNRNAYNGPDPDDDEFDNGGSKSGKSGSESGSCHSSSHPAPSLAHLIVVLPIAKPKALYITSPQAQERSARHKP